ncbi:MAG: hypothetical protein NTX50_32255 [Candidatus Sumerlaeota bacterium]|nr:hypothetical protein [Candidatus Sumerlaeota bacterium]
MNQWTIFRIQELQAGIEAPEKRFITATNLLTDSSECRSLYWIAKCTG